MALYEVMYPVNFTSSGDQTRHAINKHIKELENIYRLLNGLRRFSGGDTPPPQPETLDMWFKLSTGELLTYLPGSGWVPLIKTLRSAKADNADALGGRPAAYFLNDIDKQELASGIAGANQAATNSLNQAKSYADSKVVGLLSSDKFVFKGAWVGNGAYVPYNVVSYNGSSYILTTGDGLTPPPGGGWALLAAAASADVLDAIDGGRANTTTFTGTVGGGGAAI